MSYEMIDRYLRNNMDDDAYATYSEALDEVAQAARVQELEEAAKVVEADAVKNPVTAYQLQYNLSLQHTAKDIRALIGANHG